MGMFDYIHIPAQCPMCGHKLRTFQTKSLENMLEHYKVGDTANADKIYAHTSCPFCHSFIDIEINVEDGKITNKYNVIAVKRSWIVEVLEKIGKKTTLALYEGTTSNWKKIISLELNSHEVIAVYNILRDLFPNLHLVERDMFLLSEDSKLYKVSLEESESEEAYLTCASCGMPLTKGDLEVGKSILTGERYYEFTCPFCGSFQQAELKEPINLKIKSPMKRNMKQLLECDTVQLIFYREGWKGIKAFTSMHTSGRKASKIYGFVREIIKLKGDTIEESRIGNLPLWMILWRGEDKHIFFIAIRKKSKPEG